MAGVSDGCTGMVKMKNDFAKTFFLVALVCMVLGEFWLGVVIFVAGIIIDEVFG